MENDRNNLTLEKEDKNQHLSNLIIAVEKASLIYQNRFSPKESEIAEFCNMIVSNLRLLEYYRDENRIFGIPRYQSMVIDPSNSGFPSFNWLYNLYGEGQVMDWKSVEIPSKRTLIVNAKRRILQGKKPADEQEQMALAEYKELYDCTSLINAGTGRLKRVDSINDATLDDKLSLNDAIFQIDIIGKDQMESLYSYTRIFVVKEHGLDIYKEAEALVSHLADIVPTHSSQYIFGAVNSDNYNFRPIKVEKFTIGPFLSKWTNHNEGITKLFEQFDNSYMLFLQKETVVSQRTEIKEEKQLWRKPEITKIEHRSDAVFENIILCPFELKESFEMRYKILNENVTIYGITNGGEVYGGSNNNNQ